MSLPDGAEYWQDVRRGPRKRWHALPVGVAHPKLAQGQSPHDVPVTTRCGLDLSLGQIGSGGERAVNCPNCLA